MLTLPDDIAAAARRVGENVGHSLAQEREGNNCDGCRAERAAHAEITALVERAVREEREQKDLAISMLADWCVAVTEGGTGWDDWDDHFKNAAYRPGPLREALDAAIRSRSEPTRGGESDA